METSIATTATRWINKMKALIALLASSVFLAGCSSSADSEAGSTGSFLCVPEGYAVSVPGSTGPDESFDPDGGGYGTSILIKGQEVARRIPGFRTEVGTGMGVRHQSLYVMLAPRSEVDRGLPEGSTELTLNESDRLYKVESDSFSWPVIERSESEPTAWGSCADRFTQPESFSCMRDLFVGDLALTYPIHQQNLHLYQEIDALLLGKVEEWRCESGDIPIDR